MKNSDTCPICHNNNRYKIGEKYLFEIFRCLNCKSIYTKKIEPSTGDFDYSTYYEEDNLDIPDFVFQSLKAVIENFQPFRQNNRLLDVGCGAGTLIEVAQSLNWQAQGVEVSKTAVEHLKKRGLNVFEGMLDEAAYPEAYFDVITASEVIEHVDNPQEVIAEIARILRPGGLLYMTTPNANGISTRLLNTKWSVICPPEHIHLFSVKGMEMLVKSAGFSEIKIATHGINPIEIYRNLRRNNSKVEHTNQLPDKGQQMNGFDRVKSSYKLNQWLVNGRNKKKIKDLVNSALSTTKMGDTLKVWAVL